MPESNTVHAWIGNQLAAVHSAARLCLSRGLKTPALILIYSGMDIAGWIDSTDPSEGSKASFLRWSDQYVRPEEYLGCTSMDLYGARCGLLHRAGPESNLAESGACRPLVYSWGWRHEDDLQDLSDRLERSDLAIHIEALLESYRRAVSEYCVDLRDYPPARKEEVVSKARTIFTDMGDEVLEYVDEILRERGEEVREEEQDSGGTPS